MGANDRGRNTRRDHGKWRGRGKGRGNGRGRGQGQGSGRGRGQGQGSGRGRGQGQGQGQGRGGWPNKQNRNYNKPYENPDRHPSEGVVTKNSPNNFKSGRNPHKRERRFSYSEMIPESDLGISEFICKDKKISGILKQMYSDFIVHEIDPEGNVVKLTTMEVPLEGDAAINDSEKDSIIPDEKWLEFSSLLEKTRGGPGHVQDVKIDVTEVDKDSRGKMHAAIRKVFGTKLQSNTVNTDGKKWIVVKKWKGSDSRDNWRRGKDQQYLYFTVHKHGMDTSDTVNRISEKLRFKPGNLNFAGTKDRRACTSQRMSLWHGEPKRIKNLNIRNVWFGNYEFKSDTMKLGQLKGNLFTIALRDISNTDEEVEKNMTSLKENGFINYFGTQRFGTNKDAPTHLVGKALLQGDWEKAINLILLPRERRHGVREALECWHKEKNGEKAFSLVRGSWSSLEVMLLRGLAGAAQNDYLKAFNQLPRNLRLLYLHAYQSFIWNRIVSRRIRQFGLKTLPGDLVLDDGPTAEGMPDAEVDVDASDQLELTLQNESGEVGKSESNEVGKSESGEVGKSESAEAGKNEGGEVGKNSSTSPTEQDEGMKVRVISAEEAEKTPIDQVLLPTPGFKITLPENEVKEWYTEMLAEDGLTIESLRQKSKEYSVGGSYRNIITKPAQLEWKILRYKDPKSPLLHTDIEALKGKPEPQDDPDGALRALIVKIELGTSTYATIALRDVVDYMGALRKKNEIEDAEMRNKIQAKEGNIDGALEKDTTNPNTSDNVAVNESTIAETGLEVDMEVDTFKNVTTNEPTTDEASLDVKSKVEASESVPVESTSDEKCAASEDNEVPVESTSDEKCAASEDNELMSSNQPVKREGDSLEGTPAKKAKVDPKDEE